MKNNLNKMKDVVAHQSVLVNVTTFLNYTYFLSLQSMKNVTCWKLIIDRQKAPEKLGTLKNISLYGSFEFQPCGCNNCNNNYNNKIKNVIYLQHTCIQIVALC